VKGRLYPLCSFRIFIVTAGPNFHPQVMQSYSYELIED